ncbi:hypothetical protein COLO4_22651 [Corchorus olitorius]|uniref:RNase H type-1 domain-containing protein n=1 Tax=Corchorus olitorius TaxID=93759 RepID=A0A1R3IKU6_9ROSI|nr:hypothetical protein COLO4_22651 [Corchorus olitorius]
MGRSVVYVGQIDPVLKKVWMGLAPPKVEIFIWQALRGHIVVRNVLFERELLTEENVSCPLCKDDRETVDHLLLYCTQFNVDGSARGQPGEAGIGGILRDDSGNTKLVFSKFIGIADSNMAELLAIKEAFLIFVASEWSTNTELIIESDSLNATKWVNEPNSVPWIHRQILFQIKGLKKKIKNWSVVHVFREMYGIADTLAKSRVYRRSDILPSF